MDMTTRNVDLENIAFRYLVKRGRWGGGFCFPIPGIYDRTSGGGHNQSGDSGSSATSTGVGELSRSRFTTRQNPLCSRRSSRLADGCCSYRADFEIYAQSLLCSQDCCKGSDYINSCNIRNTFRAGSESLSFDAFGKVGPTKAV